MHTMRRFSACNENNANSLQGMWMEDSLQSNALKGVGIASVDGCNERSTMHSCHPKWIGALHKNFNRKPRWCFVVLCQMMTPCGKRHQSIDKGCDLHHELAMKPNHQGWCVPAPANTFLDTTMPEGCRFGGAVAKLPMFCGNRTRAA